MVEKTSPKFSGSHIQGQKAPASNSSVKPVQDRPAAVTPPARQEAAAQTAQDKPMTNTPQVARVAVPVEPASAQTADVAPRKRGRPRKVDAPAAAAVRPKTSAIALAAQSAPIAPAPVAAATAQETVTPAESGISADAVASHKPITMPPAPIPATAQAKAGAFSLWQMKDTTMDLNTKLNEDVKTAVAGAQEKAKAAYEKSTEALGTYAEMAKDNVEAVVESSKIFAAGVQDMGKELVSDAKEAMETFGADLKQIVSVKSPNDLFAIQSEMIRRNFDRAVAYNSKNSEAVLKLVNEAFLPISSRVSQTIDKVRKTA